MQIFLNFVTFFLLTVLSTAISDKPSLDGGQICVVGGGVSGITAALALKEKGYNVSLFEWYPWFGGKAITYAFNQDRNKEIGHVDIGPLFISDTTIDGSGPMSKYIDRYQLKTKSYDQKHMRVFDVVTNQTYHFPSPQRIPGVALAAEKYKLVWLRYKKYLKNGFLNIHPDLFLSTLDFLKKHSLHPLIEALTIAMTMEGYGDLSEVPALYTLKYISITKVPRLILPIIKLKIIEKGMWALLSEMIVDIGEENTYANHTLFEISKLPDGTQNLTFYKDNEPNDKWAERFEYIGQQYCQATILAFPPILQTMEFLFPKMTEEERYVFEMIKVHKYYSSMVQMYHEVKRDTCCYFEGKSEVPKDLPGFGHPVVEGDGEVLAFLNQDNENTQELYSAYSWIRGEFNSYDETNDEAENVRQKLEEAIPVVSETQCGIVAASWQWGYFPHVNSSSLKDGFYQMFDELQGKDGIYFATPLLSFELIDNSMQVAEEIIEKYF